MCLIGGAVILIGKFLTKKEPPLSKKTNAKRS
jgi:hypothetical protein